VTSLLVAVFAAGAAVGVGVHAWLQPVPPERIVFVDRPPPPASAPSVFAVASSAESRLEPVALAPRPQPPRASLNRAGIDSSASSSSPSPLSVERAILDEALAALAQSDGPRALRSTGEHEQRFPHGQLREEREAIAIQGLVLAGRSEEARSRAARLQATSPNSLFLPAVEASLASIP
jgi:hypothetical protein